MQQQGTSGEGSSTKGSPHHAIGAPRPTGQAMDAYQVASTLIVIIAATAWLLRPRKPPIRDAAADETPWRILATTLNCAEQGSVQALLGEEQKGSLEKWLPRGADIYAVAVQECGSGQRDRGVCSSGDDYITRRGEIYYLDHKGSMTMCDLTAASGSVSFTCATHLPNATTFAAAG